MVNACEEVVGGDGEANVRIVARRDIVAESVRKSKSFSFSTSTSVFSPLTALFSASRDWSEHRVICGFLDDGPDDEAELFVDRRRQPRRLPFRML